MSSLAGWYGHAPQSAEVLQRMADAMSGPHPVCARRFAEGLAVVTVQPDCAEAIERIAVSDDGQIVVAFAGYLFSEDDAVRRFPARRCAELYLRDGREFALSLNGSFAVVVQDARRSELHLVTDRLQSRSLYYSVGPPFLFATEVKAILEFPGVSRQVNPDRILEFLLRRRLFGPVTYYDHIACVPDACIVTWDGATVQSSRYWYPPFDRAPCPDLAENARRLYAALNAATRRASAGATRPGLMLSGGLDSRVVALASPRRLACVTLHQHEGREVRTARRVAHRLGHSHYFERLPDAFPLELATEGTLVADGRDGFQHAYPLYLERWLHDEGVDALLGGWFLETYFSDTDLLRSGVKVRGQERPLPLLASMEELDIPEWVWQWRLKGNQREMGELVPAERLERVAADAKQRIRARMDDLCRRASNGQALATVVRTGELSTHQTHANATAAERLAPAPILLCDTDLIELFFDIPREHRLLHRLYSHVLTAVDRRVRWVPYSNTGVPVSSWMWAEYLAGSLRQEASRAAEACWRRVSPGYAPTRFAWPPFGPTVRARPEWQAYLRRRASASRLADLGVLSGDGVRRLVEEHLGGQRRDWELLKLWVTVEEWLERYG